MNENTLLLNPIIILINKYSGGQQGQVIYRQLIQILNPRQVFLLENSAMLDSILEMYKYLENIRIFICGGDGTVGWVLSRIAEKYSSLKNPPVSICPLGTGNDLARVLGWGWTYQSKNLFKTLLQTSVAQPVPFDRWKISLESLRQTNINDEHRNATRLLCSCLLEEPKFVVETDPPSYLNYRQPLNTHFTNYLSFGLDAAVVLDFHHQRIQNPSRFTSPTKNKFLYINISRKYLKEFVLWKSWSLFPYMKLICDGVDLTDSLRSCHSLILLNIPSYGSGARPWARTSNNISSETTDDNHLNQAFQSNRQNSSTIFQQQSFADRKIEVLGVNSLEMAFIHIGCRGQRIAQCHQVTIELDRSMPVHMDGEPFYLSRSTAIHITHAGQVLLLSNSSS
ncbi:hypothetical protein I4U23_016497 [Adineta vaga]|nr:hypothetical protein I4U23_016497 [Adineta vaga]